MFLNSQMLNVSFRCMYEGRSYMLYASTGEMRCYECGAIGHVRLSCPVSAVAGPSGIQTEVQVNSHRKQTVINTEDVENDKEIPTEEVRNDEEIVTDSVRKENELSDGNEQRVEREEVQMSDIDDVRRMEGQMSRECELTDSGKMENQGDDKNVNSREPKEKVRKLGEDEVDDEDGVLSDFSEFSDISQVGCDQVYSLEEIKVFLDETFGKVADVRNFFSDVKKFESSVLYWQKREGEENLSQQERFRLKKILTKLRKGKTPVKRKSN